MSNFKNLLRRGRYGLGALGLLVGVTAPALLVSLPASADQVQTRSIKMSDSKASASGVTYVVNFTPASSTTIQGMVVDFCSNDPIEGDTCTAPGGFSVGTVAGAGNTTVNVTGESGTWTAASANTGRTLELTSSSTGTPTGATITLTTVTNPSATGSFYARIFTFANSSDVASWESDTDGGNITAGEGASTLGVVDFGGVALSTANNITITAKVMESLGFCVSGTSLAPSDDCSSATSASLTLGHGSPVATLDSSAVDTASAYTQISSNAKSGVKVLMKSDKASGGLESSAGNTIPAIGATAKAITKGTEDFGLFVSGSSISTVGTVTGTGTVTPTAPYDGNGHTTIPTDLFYGMDTTAGTGVTSTYGSQIESSAGPISLVNNQLVFGATASLTTPAGIYTADETLIATGTF